MSGGSASGASSGSGRTARRCGRASIGIGGDAAYLQRFIHRGTFEILAKRDREALSGSSGLVTRWAGARPDPVSEGAST